MKRWSRVLTSPREVSPSVALAVLIASRTYTPWTPAQKKLHHRTLTLSEKWATCGSAGWFIVGATTRLPDVVLYCTVFGSRLAKNAAKC